MTGKFFNDLRKEHPHWWVIIVIVAVLAVCGVWATLLGRPAADISRSGLTPPAAVTPQR